MIRELSKKFKHMIISTGATFDSEIIKTNEILKKKNIDYSFLHCVTLYPTPLSNLHLSRIKYLSNITKKKLDIPIILNLGMTKVYYLQKLVFIMVQK